MLLKKLKNYNHDVSSVQNEMVKKPLKRKLIFGRILQTRDIKGAIAIMRSTIDIWDNKTSLHYEWPSTCKD